MPRLRNQALREMVFKSLDKWQAKRQCKQYIALLVRRCEAQASARCFLEAIGRRLRCDAETLQTRQIWRIPSVSEEDARLPAAILADRAREALDMPRLRLASGRELVLPVDRRQSLHDFHEQAKYVLELDPKGNISLALLRHGCGSVEERLLHCSRTVHAWRHVKRKVFEVVQHP